MSRPETPEIDDSDLPAPICEFCGFPITEEFQQCAARPEGEVCAE